MNSQGVKLEFPIGLSLLHLSKYKSAEVSVAGRGSELLTLDAERRCWEQCTVLRWEARCMGDNGEGELMCHVMQREVIMSLVFALHTLLTPPKHFHAICAICHPNCAPSTVPVNIWLAALRLSSGLSLWISMCSSSTSLSLPIVYFISFPSFILSLPKSPQSARSQAMMPRGGIGWSADDFHKGSEEQGLQLWLMMSYRLQLIRVNDGSALASVDLAGGGGVNVKWQQVVTGWQRTDRSGSNATLAKSSFRSQWSVSS